MRPHPITHPADSTGRWCYRGNPFHFAQAQNQAVTSPRLSHIHKPGRCPLSPTTQQGPLQPRCPARPVFSPGLPRGYARWQLGFVSIFTFFFFNFKVVSQNLKIGCKSTPVFFLSPISFSRSQTSGRMLTLKLYQMLPCCPFVAITISLKFAFQAHT